MTPVGERIPTKGRLHVCIERVRILAVKYFVVLVRLGHTDRKVGQPALFYIDKESLRWRANRSIIVEANLNVNLITLWRVLDIRIQSSFDTYRSRGDIEGEPGK